MLIGAVVKIVANPIGSAEGPSKSGKPGRFRAPWAWASWYNTVKMEVPTAGSLLGSPTRAADAITA